MAYIGQDSPAYAAAFVQEILIAARSLDELAERGRLVPEVARDDVRELFVGAYRLVFRLEDDLVTIAALVHGRRDFRRFWRTAGR